MKNSFVHLHVHSEYTLLSGVNKIKDLPKLAKENGMNALAITDTCNMFGVVQFYKSCVQNQIHPIIGSEIYVDGMYPLVLLVINEEGYNNLIKIVSILNTYKKDFKPKIDEEILQKYSTGLIALSGGTKGKVEQNILSDYDKAKSIGIKYKEIFKDNYYLELQENNTIDRKILNQQLIKLGKELSIPVVATNDVYYPKKEDSILKKVVLCIKNGTKLEDIEQTENQDETNSQYFKSIEEMEQDFREIPEALENTVKIANKCKFEFEFGEYKLPVYISGKEKEKDKEENKEEKEKEYKDKKNNISNNINEITKKINIGLKKRYGNIKDEKKKKKIVDRAKYELQIVNRMGFVDYFLIVADFVNYAKENDIPVGPGRGSGAGSLLAYLLGITEIDPIKYNLFFERFLNPERVTMPDFDIDFCNEKREQVIKYVSEKYGAEHVTQIITFGTLSARMVIRDIGRLLNIPYIKVDKISKSIPAKPKILIDEALEKSIEFKRLYETDEETKKIVELAKKIEGIPRNISTHASGVVVTDKKTIDYVPLYITDESIQTQYTMDILEELGLLKIDFLGLRTLTVIDKTEKLIYKLYGKKVLYGNYDDKEVFKLWKSGKTLGVFQFESTGIMNVMKNLSPNTIDDIMAGTALYRPGPMKYIPQYIEGKRNKNSIKYIHKSLEDILNVTNGCIVYQEQVMQIARKLAGYSYQKADLLRKAMGKKKKEIIDNEKNTFLNGCIKNGIDIKIATEIFNELQEFAKFAFNKSHAACYAHISYKTAYLKRYYPAELLTIIMNSYNGNIDKIAEYIEDARNLGIKVLPPDVNESCVDFSVAYINNKPVIRFGLSSIKNVGLIVAKEIVNEHRISKFKDFKNFIIRMKSTNVNKRAIEALILSGTFNNIEKNQKSLYLSYEKMLEEMQNQKVGKYIEGQSSFFEMIDNEVDKTAMQVTSEYIQTEDFTEIEKMKYEKEMIGIYISQETLSKVYKYFEDKINITGRKFLELKQTEEYSNNFKNNMDNSIVRAVGIIEKIDKRYSKKGNLVVKVKIHDITGQLDLIIFDKTYEKVQKNLIEGCIILIEGKLSLKNVSYPTIIVNNLTKINIKNDK